MVFDLMGIQDLSIDQHPQKNAADAKANHYLTGRDGGRELDLRHHCVEGNAAAW
jgi:putative flavoprotein involved in K+ transport